MIDDQMIRGAANGKGGTDPRAVLADAAGQIRERAGEAIDQVEQTYGAVRDGVADTLDEINRFTTARPLAALGLAVLAGWVLGHTMGAGRPKVVILRPPSRP